MSTLSIVVVYYAVSAMIFFMGWDGVGWGDPCIFMLLCQPCPFVLFCVPKVCSGFFFMDYVVVHPRLPRALQGSPELLIAFPELARASQSFLQLL